jgi:hypothetical protein
MHPEKANYFNTQPIPAASSGPLHHPRPQVVGVSKSRIGAAIVKPVVHPERKSLPTPPNNYSKWDEHDLYRTTNRQRIPVRHEYDKERYYGRMGDFTKTFVGGMYRNVSLSTSIPECPVLHHENFGYP